jgi:hypothetical protein
VAVTTDPDYLDASLLNNVDMLERVLVSIDVGYETYASKRLLMVSVVSNHRSGSGSERGIDW